MVKTPFDGWMSDKYIKYFMMQKITNQRRSTRWKKKFKNKCNDAEYSVGLLEKRFSLLEITDEDLAKDLKLLPFDKDCILYLGCTAKQYIKYFN